LAPAWSSLQLLGSSQSLSNSKPSHIRRIENKVAERLANVGVDSTQQIILHDSRKSQKYHLWFQCEEFAQLDGPNEDVVPSLSTYKFFQVKNDEKLRREGD
jgi:hypothetical protein